MPALGNQGHEPAPPRAVPALLVGAGVNDVATIDLGEVTGTNGEHKNAQPRERWPGG
jgi:hypothetical protein